MKKAVLIICCLSLAITCRSTTLAAGSSITHGHVILCSDEVPNQEVTARLIDLAGGSPQTVIILNLTPQGNGSSELAQKLKAAFEKFSLAVKTVAVDWHSGMQDEAFHSRETSRALWVFASNPATSIENSETLRTYLSKFQAKGGVIAAGGAATALLTDTVLLENTSNPRGGSTQSSSGFRKSAHTSAEGLEIVRDLIVDRDSIKRSHLNFLIRTLLNQPRKTIVGIDENGAVWIKPNGDIEAIGPANVLILSAHRARIDTEPETAKESAYLSAEGVQIHVLWRGGIYNVVSHIVKAIGQMQTRGHLILLGGGGGFPADALDKFLDLIGGRDQLVLILSIGLDGRERQQQEFQAIKEVFTKEGCQNVQGVFLDSAQEAEDPKLVELVSRARGVVFGGGDQRRITRVLQGTPIEKALWKIYSDGAVISGASAGAAIQGQLMITGDAKTLAEDKGLPSAFHTIRVGNVELTSGMGFFPGAIVDQHFLSRSRGNRLLSTILEHPNLIGVGIDGGAAVWLKPDQTFQVLGNSSVMVINASGAEVGLGETIAGVPGERTVAARNLSIVLVSPGRGFDLKTRKLIYSEAPRRQRPARRKTAQIRAAARVILPLSTWATKAGRQTNGQRYLSSR